MPGHCPGYIGIEELTFDRGHVTRVKQIVHSKNQMCVVHFLDSLFILIYLNRFLMIPLSIFRDNNCVNKVSSGYKSQPGIGITPICCIKPNESSETQSSTTLPSENRSRLIPATLTALPLGGIPNSTAVCVPLICHLTATISPSPKVNSTFMFISGKPSLKAPKKPTTFLTPATG